MIENYIVFVFAIITARCFHLGLKYSAPCAAGMPLCIIGMVFVTLLLFPQHIHWLGFQKTNWFDVLAGVVTYIAVVVIKNIACSYYKKKKESNIQKHGE